MMYAVYGLWAIALIFAVRLGLTLFYQWKYKDMLSVNPFKQRQQLIKNVAPLVLILVFSFTIHSQVNTAPEFEFMHFRTLEPQKADENVQGFFTTATEDLVVDGMVVVEHEGVETSYFVITIRGVQYLIENPEE